MDRIQERQNIPPFLALLVLFILGAFLFRYDMLDDSYITLRYADNFLGQFHFFYNSGQDNYGCSAPGYVLLLVPLEYAFGHLAMPDVAKGIGILMHLVLLLLLMRELVKYRQAGFRAAWAAVFFLLLCPAAFRWLEDGMETAVVGILAFLLGRKIGDLNGKGGPDSGADGVDSMALLAAAALVFIRVDMLIICFGAALVAWRLRGWRSGLVLLVAALIPFVAWRLYFGFWDPDTAVAKSIGGFRWGWFVSAARASASLSPAWLLVPLAPLLGSRKRPLIVALAFGPLLATIGLGALRDQAVLGARYFLPPLLFALGMVFPFVDWDEIGMSRWGKWAGLILLAHFGVMVWASASVVVPPYTDFSLVPRGSIIASEDIGQIGWFTGATIVDLGGLVNGRKVAALRGQEQVAASVDAVGRPDLFIVRPDTWERVKPFVQAQNWHVVEGPVVMRNMNLSSEVTRRIYWISGTALTSVSPKSSGFRHLKPNKMMILNYLNTARFLTDYCRPNEFEDSSI
jgi:hypothetical protein